MGDVVKKILCLHSTLNLTPVHPGFLFTVCDFTSYLIIHPDRKYTSQT